MDKKETRVATTIKPEKQVDSYYPLGVRVLGNLQFSVWASVSFFQSLKLYAWEEPFLNKVTQIRRKELWFLRNASFINAIIEFTFICSPVLVSLTLSVFPCKIILSVRRNYPLKSVMCSNLCFASVPMPLFSRRWLKRFWKSVCISLIIQRILALQSQDFIALSCFECIWEQWVVLRVWASGISLPHLLRFARITWLYILASRTPDSFIVSWWWY